MAEKWGEYCPSCLWKNQHENGNPCSLCVYTDKDPSKFIRVDETKRAGYWCENCRYNGISANQFPCNGCEWDMMSNSKPSEWAEKDNEPKLTKLPGAKDSKGKLKLSDVPKEVIWAIGKVREYGNQKYDNPDNWKFVEPWKFHEAMLRHVYAVWEDWGAIDPESHLPHLWHLVTNAAFLCYFLNEEMKDEPT